MKGVALFVKVSGYSLYVYFLLFNTKRASAREGGMGEGKWSNEGKSPSIKKGRANALPFLLG